jgi:prepilin-type N-terminal cleavage/methylation domain-containing protein
MEVPAERGFTLIELIIVVAIIAIIAALATAGLLRSRAAANEASAIASIRVTSSSQKAYAVSCGFGAYATSYVVLGTSVGTGAAYISADLGTVASPTKAGYRFNLSAGAGSSAGPTDCAGRPTMTAFYATAVPTSVWSGARSFALNADGAVWQISGSTAPTEPFGPPARPLQ